MIFKDKQIKELYNLKHINDDNKEGLESYENNILRNFLSPVLYNNNNMKDYLNLIQKFVVLMIEEVNYVRNFYNTAVDKHYSGYKS